MSDYLRPHGLQHARPPCPSPSPEVHSDSHPLSPWCHPAISSSVIPFSSYPQSLPASESFPMSQLFAWGGQSTGISALESFLPKNTQGWSPLEWTGWISLHSKGLSRVFSNTTVRKHQFFGAQPSSQSNSHIHTWLLIRKDSDAGRDWEQEEKRTTEDEMAGWHHGLDGRESEWTSGDGDGQGGLACCDSWGHKESSQTRDRTRIPCIGRRILACCATREFCKSRLLLY